MNPAYREILGSLIRTLVVYLAGRFGVTLTDDQVPAEIISGGVAAAMLGWSVWQKVRVRRKLVTALGSPRKMSEDQLDDVVATEVTPSVLTPTDTIPKASVA